MSGLFMCCISNIFEQVEIASKQIKMKNAKLRGHGARQKQDLMTTKIKYEAEICRVYGVC